MLKLPSASVNPDSHSKKSDSKLKLLIIFLFFKKGSDWINKLFFFILVLVELNFLLYIKFINWIFLSLFLINLVGTIKNNPCKPVEQKNADPNTESAIVKDELLYSKTCRDVKIMANIIVNNVPNIVALLFPKINEWWAHVIVAPLESNNKVLSKGILQGFKGSIPNGGHWPPSSIAGDKLEWKKAQNIERKAKASLIIKRTIP